MAVWQREPSGCGGHRTRHLAMPDPAVPQHRLEGRGPLQPVELSITARANALHDVLEFGVVGGGCRTLGKGARSEQFRSVDGVGGNRLEE